MAGEHEHNGWMVRESGPSDAAHRLLLLPGGLCTTSFFEDLEAQPGLAGASIGFVAATLPGQGGAPPLDDPGFENLARRAGDLAADFRCDGVVGHSLGGNVALEMAALGVFSGPMALLSPSLSRRDESRVLRGLDVMSRVLGPLPYAAALKMIGPAMKREIPPGRQDALLRELRKNDPRDTSRSIRPYLAYLDRHGSLAPRLCASGVRASVVYGEHDDVGITSEERRTLDECPTTTVVVIPGAGHLTLCQRPDRVAEVVLRLLS